MAEAPRYKRMTAAGQDTDDKRIIKKYAMYKIAKNTIYSIDNYVCTSLLCANLN